jgi:hypothetical protein
MAAEILPALRPGIHRLLETETRVNEKRGKRSRLFGHKLHFEANRCG